MAHLLSCTFFFKRVISRNFFWSRNPKLTHIDKNKKKDMFSSQFSIHKRKKISKSVNKRYILAKILNFNSDKKKIAFQYASLIAGRDCAPLDEKSILHAGNVQETTASYVETTRCYEMSDSGSEVFSTQFIFP